MNIKSLKQFKEIEEDCLKLKRKNDLTEFGRGELHVVEVVRKLKIGMLIMIIYKLTRDKKLNKVEEKLIERVVEYVDY